MADLAAFLGVGMGTASTNFLQSTYLWTCETPQILVFLCLDMSSPVLPTVEFARSLAEFAWAVLFLSYIEALLHSTIFSILSLNTYALLYSKHQCTKSTFEFAGLIFEL